MVTSGVAMTRIAPTLVCFLLSRCAGPDAPGGPETVGTEDDSAPAAIDADGDGSPDDIDCNDDDAAIHPGAVEHCDGVDEDCDTVVDEEAIDAPSWYADVDGDGYGGEKSVRACISPTPGDVATSEDCDDTDATTHPGASEICGDGRDNDCVEGVDGSCRLAGALPALDHLHVIAPGDVAPSETAAHAGFVAAVGDTNGDGNADLLVGFQASAAVDSGRIVLCFGPLLAIDSFADCTTSVPSPGGKVAPGYIEGVGVGDLDGDGYDDIAIGDDGAFYGDFKLEQYPGIFVFHGSPLDDPPLVPAYADASYISFAFGMSLAAGPILDGEQMLISSGSFAVYILDATPEPADVRVPPYEPFATLHDGEFGLGWNPRVENLDDVDGDGVTDIGISPTGFKSAAYLVSGVVPEGSFDVEDAQASFRGESRLGRIGDTNGDGYADLIVQAKQTLHVSDPHAVFLFGPVADDFVFDESTFDGTLLFRPPERSYELIFEDVDGIDLDGDSLSDVVASFNDDETPIEIAYGPISGAAEPDVWLARGEAPAPGFISDIADLGDIDGDGSGDVAFQGSPFALPGSTVDEPGNVYLLFRTGI